MSSTLAASVGDMFYLFFHRSLGMASYFPEHKLLFIHVRGAGSSATQLYLQQHMRFQTRGNKHASLESLRRRGELTDVDPGQCLVLANIRNPYDRLATYFARAQGHWIEANLIPAQQRTLARKRRWGQLTPEQLRALERVDVRSVARHRRERRKLRLMGFTVWFGGQCLGWRLFNRGRPLAYELFPMLDGVDLVLRQELLSTALVQLVTGLGVTAEKAMDTINTTPGKRHYQSYYNAISRALLAQFLEPTVREWGYGFDGLRDASPILALTENGRAWLTAAGLPVVSPPLVA